MKFKKKKDEFLGDIDLDMPPEPPKMMEEEISALEPIDEELMPSKEGKAKKLKVKAPKAEKLPELPPLPEMEEEELPPLPEMEEELGALPELPSTEEKPELGELDLPPPPQLGVKKKGFFSFLKPKKAAEELPLPRIWEEVSEMPALPSLEEEFPEMPPIDKEEVTPMPELEREISAPKPIPTFKPEVKKPLPKKEVMRIERKFVTINDFREVQNNISNVKGVLKCADAIFSGLEEVKINGDKEYMGLCNSLKDVQRKIMFIDKTLFKEV